MSSNSPLMLMPLQLERESNVRRQWRIGDLKLLAKAYGIHWLMFGPLLIDEVEDKLCHLQHKDAIENVAAWTDSTVVQIQQIHLARLLRLFRAGRSLVDIQNRLSDVRTQCTTTGGDHQLGENVVYASPSRKLAGSEDIAIVHLTLQPGGVSDWHRHPGDELMLVLEGKINVHLQDNGIHTELGSGDFIHFYAEQKHGAVNPGRKVAKVIIIRFLQLTSLGTRYSFHQDAKGAGGRAKTQAFEKRARQELAKSLMPFDLTELSESDGRIVMDRFGLGRLLQAAAKANRLPAGKLVQKAKRRDMRYDKNRFNHIQDGISPVTQEELIELAELYDLYPITLLDYIHPAHRPVIQVSNPIREENVPTNWSDVPHSFVGTEDIFYLIPQRRLADSDLSVSFLRMPPGSRTGQKNKHPGFELILPMSGAVNVEIESEMYELSNKSHLYAHFVSDRFHRIINNSDAEAKLFVIRFYGSPSSANKRKRTRMVD